MTTLRKFILFLLTLFSFIKCGLVFENIPLYLIEGKMRNELINIESLHPLSNIKFPDYSVKLSDGTEVNITQFNLFSNIIDEYSFEFSYNLQSGNLSLTSKNISGFFPLNCIMKCDLEIKDNKYPILFTFSASYYNLVKNYKKTDGFFYDFGVINSKFVFNKIIENLSPYSDEELNKILQQWFKENENKLSEGQNTYGALSYYHSLDFIKLMPKVSTNTFNFPNEHTIDMTNEEIKFENQSILFTKYGKLDDINETVKGVYKGDLNKYQLIIHRKFFENLFTNSLFGFNIFKESKVSDKYELNVGYLKQIFEIPSYISDDILISIRNEMINITFDTDINDKISGIVYINSDFISNDTKDILVSIKMEIKYNFINELFQNALNFALYGNNAKVISVSLNPTITSKIIDEGKLKDWIDDTIKRGLGKNIFNLLEDPIDLSIYFKRTQKVELEIKDNEYYIFNGNPRI